MRRPTTALLLAAHALAFAQPQPAEPQDDSARIPLSVLEEDDSAAAPPPAAAARSASVFLEGNGEVVSRRDLLVPVPAVTSRRREVLRLLADGRGDWQLGPGLTSKASARVAATQTEDGGHRRDEQFDLREAALQWRLDDGDVAEAGRVNLRQGAALGFNPTDYFRARAAVDTSTRDPQEQRNNRLGTVMLNAQRVGARGSLLVALAPRLSQPASLLEPEPQRRLRLGDTNGETRLLLKGQWQLGASFSPELLAFRDAAGWRLGANLTQALGQQATWYVEYSGGRRKPLFQRALEDGVALGDLPAAALDAAQPPAGERWQNELAVGGTWTGANRLSLTLEFDYHQAGFNEADWQRWFALGTSGNDGAALAWYVRSHAGARQEPLFRRNLFVRAQWDQAGHRDLSLNAFVNRNLDDHSSLGQVALEWRLSQAGRLRAMALFTRGDRRSQYGSDPARHAVLAGYVHYL
jgi:hypothetical protein